MNILESLSKYYLEEEPLEEMNVTADIDGGAGQPRTPHAFQSKPKSSLDKKKQRAMEKGVPYEVAEETNILFKRMEEMCNKVDTFLREKDK